MINVCRTLPGPEITSDYRSEEVMEQLAEVFLNKCYLCETREDHASIFEVDHYRDQASNPNLKTTWSNLYLCCRTCNGIKRNTWSGENLLDPCEDDHDVESFIRYNYDHHDDAPEFFPRAPEQFAEKTETTVALLRAVHEGHTAKSRLKTAELRGRISKQVNNLMLQLRLHYAAKESKDQEEIENAKEKIRRLLTRSAPFAMILRSVLRPNEAKEFKNYLD